MPGKRKEVDRNSLVKEGYEFPPSFDRILELLVIERKTDTIKGQKIPSAKMRAERPTLWIDRHTGEELRLSSLDLFRDWIPGCTLGGARIKNYIDRMRKWRSNPVSKIGNEYPLLRDAPQLVGFFFEIASYNPAWFTPENEIYTEGVPFASEQWKDCQGKTLIDPCDPLRRDIALAFQSEAINGSILTREQKLQLHMMREYPSIEQNYPEFFARSKVSAEMRQLLNQIPDNPAIGLLQSKLAIYVAQAGSIENAIDDIISVAIDDLESQIETENTMRSKLKNTIDGIIKKGTIPLDSSFPNAYWAIACVLQNDDGDFYGGDIFSLFEDCGIISARQS